MIEGFCLLEWHATAKRYWGRIIVFSIFFLPVFFSLHLLGITIIRHPNVQIGQEISFRTCHAICRGCWRRHRLRKGLAFLATLACGFVLAISFAITLIAGSLMTACLARWWDYKPREAKLPALIFAGSLVLCMVSKMVINRIPARIFAPSSLRLVAKKPFTIFDAKLLPYGEGGRDESTLADQLYRRVTNGWPGPRAG